MLEWVALFAAFFIIGMFSWSWAYYVLLIYVGVLMIKYVVQLVMVSIINAKIRKLNKIRLEQYIERRKLMTRMKQIKYLRGEPVTVKTRDGNIKLIQSGKTDVILSTIN